LDFLKSRDATNITDTQHYQPCIDFLAAKVELGNTIETFMKNNSVDLLVYPYDNQLPPLIKKNQQHQDNLQQDNQQDSPQQETSFLTALISSVSGLPSISVPMGLADNVPIGLTVLGKRNSEKELLQFAYSWDILCKKRKPPL